jgi:hypothetical protein
MAADLISKKTRSVLREMLAGRTLRIIHDEFEAAGVLPDASYQPPFSSERRLRIEQFYRGMDFSKPQDRDRFLEICESFLRGADTGAEDELLHWLERDGIAMENGRLRPVSIAPMIEELRAATASMDMSHLAGLIDRMCRSVDSDPDLAIGTAKDLVESTAKSIMAERGKEVVGSPDLTDLVKRVRTELSLIPEGIQEEAKGRDIIKRVLSSFASVVQGLAELRGLYGSGHGRHGRSSGLKARHARLATGAAATLATFLFETHIERQAPDQDRRDHT